MVNDPEFGVSKLDIALCRLSGARVSLWLSFSRKCRFTKVVWHMMHECNGRRSESFRRPDVADDELARANG